jgi:hypothetical protein
MEMKIGWETDKVEIVRKEKIIENLNFTMKEIENSLKKKIEKKKIKK